MKTRSPEPKNIRKQGVEHLSQAALQFGFVRKAERLTLYVEENIFGSQQLSLAENEAPVYRILQFSHITRPIMGHHLFEHGRVGVENLGVELPAIEPKKIFSQLSDIHFMFS